MTAGLPKRMDTSRTSGPASSTRCRILDRDVSSTESRLEREPREQDAVWLVLLSRAITRAHRRMAFIGTRSITSFGIARLLPTLLRELDSRGSRWRTAA